MASHHGQPQCCIMIATTPPMKPTIEPTDRSMWPAMMTMTMPAARIITYAFCWIRLATLFGSRSLPSVMISKSRTIAKSAPTMPY